MAKVRVTYDQHSGAVHALLYGRGREVDRDMYRRAVNVRNLAARYAGRRTGRLASTLYVVPARRVGWRVGSAQPYALVHHEGRRGIRVTRRARSSDRPGALRFRPRGSRFIFRREVGPAEGTHFLTRALKAARR